MFPRQLFPCSVIATASESQTLAANQKAASAAKRDRDLLGGAFFLGALEFSVFSTPERRSLDTLARPAMACHDCGDAASTTLSTRHEEDIEDLGEARGASFRERVPVSPRRDSSRVSLTLSSRNARRTR